MASYTFKSESTGQIVEKTFPMAEAPPIGSLIEIDGDMYRRLVDIPQLSADNENRTHGYPYVSKSLPRNMKGAETNKLGQPIVTSRWHEKELSSRHDLKRD
jgi:hypothetical protein